MGNIAKTMTGARAQVLIAGKPVGIFSDVSWGLAYGAEPVFILGAYGPQEIVYTSQEAVQITARGWKIIDHGAHTDALVPKLQDLLRHQDIELACYDRQTGSFLGRMHNCRPTGYQTGVTAKGLQELTVNFVGLTVDDESPRSNAETEGAATLP